MASTCRALHTAKPVSPAGSPCLEAGQPALGASHEGEELLQILVVRLHAAFGLAVWSALIAAELLDEGDEGLGRDAGPPAVSRATSSARRRARRDDPGIRGDWPGRGEMCGAAEGREVRRSGRDGLEDGRLHVGDGRWCQWRARCGPSPAALTGAARCPAQAGTGVQWKGEAGELREPEEWDHGDDPAPSPLPGEAGVQRTLAGVRTAASFASRSRWSGRVRGAQGALRDLFMGGQRLTFRLFAIAWIASRSRSPAAPQPARPRGSPA